MAAENIPLGPGAEFDTIRTMLGRWGTLASGIGDDAALLEIPAGAKLVTSVDVSVENVHFRREWLSAEEIAYRAATAALSDLAAMGATPLGMLIALTLTEAWRAQVDSLADGFAIASRDNAAPIVGGDLSAGSELSIGITVLGSTDRPLTRGGAKNGDALWVTGKLGGPRLALRALESGQGVHPAHRSRFARPTARIREGRWLAEHGATAAIDISDGVASEASHVAVASRARVILDLDALPLIEGAAPADAAASGEEYELLVAAPGTLDARAFEREFGVPLTVVGHVESVRGGIPGAEAQSGGIRVPLPVGHSHFSG